jgi:transcriptional regulator with XRE-family HTH domain
MKKDIIAVRIRETRQSMNLTQVQLAKKLRTSQGLIAKLEHGGADYKVSQLRAIARLTDTPRASLTFLVAADQL